MFCFEIFLKIFDFYEYFTALTSLNYLDKFLRIVHALTSLNSSKWQNMKACAVDGEGWGDKGNIEEVTHCLWQKGGGQDLHFII